MRETVRLECLKLCHRHDRAPADVVTAAKVYEAYILESVPVVTVTPATTLGESEAAPIDKKIGASQRKKKSDNSSLLD